MNASVVTKAVAPPTEKRILDPSEILKRPDELVPVMVTFESASPRDYIACGLVAPSTLMEHRRTGRHTMVELWDARCVIRYNVSSGGLYGLAASGPVEGGYGVRLSLPTLTPVIGLACLLQPMTLTTWERLSKWRSISDE